MNQPTNNEEAVTQESVPVTDTDEELSFAQLFEESLKDGKIQIGEVAKGRIIQITSDFVVVDVGFKSEGQIPVGEFMDYGHTLKVKEGDSVDVFVEDWENENGMMSLSKEKADRMLVWDKINDIYADDGIIEGTVISRIKGGLSVDIGLKAFLPGSQVDLHPIRDLDSLMGKNFDFKILKLSKKRGNIVLSRRAILEKERESLRGETLKKIKVGEILKGIVKNITDYGVFIDLGGIDGLLHVTDISWGRITSPRDYFTIGDEIDVKILSYDEENQRVALGYKQMKVNPWEVVAEKYPVGSRISGKIVNITNYGAFIELEEGVEGLIHISELSWTKKVKHPSQILSIADVVEAVVLDMDVLRKRISLGLKQLEPNPWTAIEEKYPIGTIVEGAIKNITDFGVFLGLEEGIDGLVHISDISWTQKIKHPAEIYKKSEIVKAVVLSIDKDNERFSLGIKQLEPDPWEIVPKKYRRGQVVKGVVTNITDFGIFLEIEEGVEGLIHVSEIGEDKAGSLKELATVGEDLEALIISIDKRSRKIGLSLRELKDALEKKDIDNYLEDEKDASTATLGDVMRAESAAAAKAEAVPAAEAAPPVVEAAAPAEEAAPPVVEAAQPVAEEVAAPEVEETQPVAEEAAAPEVEAEAEPAEAAPAAEAETPASDAEPEADADEKKDES